MEKVVFKWGLEGRMGLANVKMLEKGIQGRKNHAERTEKYYLVN